MRFAHVSLCTLLLVAAICAQPPEPLKDEVVEDVYLARDDGAGKAGDVTETFSPGDIPIHCIVMLTKANPVAVKMNMVAVKVAGVKPESRVVSAAYSTKQGQDRVFFTGRPDGKWVAGSYRIDVFVEGKLEKSISFDVRGVSPPQAASQFVPAKPKPQRIAKKRN